YALGRDREASDLLAGLASLRADFLAEEAGEDEHRQGDEDDDDDVLRHALSLLVAKRPANPRQHRADLHVSTAPRAPSTSWSAPRVPSGAREFPVKTGPSRQFHRIRGHTLVSD